MAAFGIYGPKSCSRRSQELRMVQSEQDPPRRGTTAIWTWSNKSRHSGEVPKNNHFRKIWFFGCILSDADHLRGRPTTSDLVQWHPSTTVGITHRLWGERLSMSAETLKLCTLKAAPNDFWSFLGLYSSRELSKNHQKWLPAATSLKLSDLNSKTFSLLTQLEHVFALDATNTCHDTRRGTGIALGQV